MKQIERFFFFIVAIILFAANAHAGRWLSRDPMEVQEHMERDPHAFLDLNPYTFVRNNPLTYIDPYGLEAGYTYHMDGRMTIGDPAPFPQAVGDIGRFATGIGSRQRNYGLNDPIVNDLQISPGIMQQRAIAIARLRDLRARNKPCPDSKQRTPFQYSLLGAGYGKAFFDLLDIGLMTDNANMAAIGSYSGYYTIQNVDYANGTATLAFHVDNDMGLASASRSPNTGNSLFGNNPTGSHGPLSTVHEHFDFTTTIIFGK